MSYFVLYSVAMSSSDEGLPELEQDDSMVTGGEKDKVLRSTTAKRKAEERDAAKVTASKVAKTGLGSAPVQHSAPVAGTSGQTAADVVACGKKVPEGGARPKVKANETKSPCDDNNNEKGEREPTKSLAERGRAEFYAKNVSIGYQSRNLAI